MPVDDHADPRQAMHGDTLQTHQRGFSLIELLVTTIVIAIAASFILPRLSWIRSTPPLQDELRDLAARIELARDEAALQGRNFGIRFYPDGYAFLDLDDTTLVWTTMEGDELLGSEQFDEDSLPRLRIEERDIELELPDTDDDDERETDAFGNVIEQAGETPHVVILSSGEVTPFLLEIESLQDDAYARLEGDFLGQMTLSDQRP